MEPLQLLLLAIQMGYLVSEEAETGCPVRTAACFKDCCFKNEQFCNTHEKRCTRCDARQNLCGTVDEPFGCELYCHRLLQTTTTPAVPNTTFTTPSSDTPTSPETPQVSLPTYLLIVICVILTLALLAVIIFMCVIHRKRKSKQQRSKEIEEGQPLTHTGGGKNTSKDRRLHRQAQGGSGRSSYADTNASSEAADLTAVGVVGGNGQNDTTSDQSEDPVQEAVRDGSNARVTEPSESHNPSPPGVSDPQTAPDAGVGPGRGDATNGGHVHATGPPDPGGSAPASGQGQTRRLHGDRDVIRSPYLSEVNFNDRDHDLRHPSAPNDTNGIGPAVTLRPPDQHSATVAGVGPPPLQQQQDRFSHMNPTTEHTGRPYVCPGTDDPTAYVRRAGSQNCETQMMAIADNPIQ
ncbi:hypothetical protein BaRGS_00006714 [Batillaria attramentaria]|uniref:TNFR-Cys domain-containing protein n=1 Tax=Batillaria attramentaria TaxID=370345 RepID=A0ABD0LR76_9CAEN